MLGVLGLIIPDVLGAPLYMLPELGTERLLPFTIIVVVAFGGLEIYRVQSIIQGRDLNTRVYPGGKRFDPLGLASREQSNQKPSKRPGNALQEQLATHKVACLTRQSPASQTAVLQYSFFCWHKSIFSGNPAPELLYHASRKTCARVPCIVTMHA